LQSVTTFDDLKKSLNCESNGLEEVIAHFPMRINPYCLIILQKHGKPLAKQVLQDIQELQNDTCLVSPFNEYNLSPVPHLVHRYPDRVLFLMTNQSALYCRFSHRKRKVGSDKMKISPESIDQGITYITTTPSIREVLLFGGDPLMLEDSILEYILTKLREIPTVQVIRIGTRIPCALPMRIPPDLLSLLKRFHPLYINTHFNHPAEIADEAAAACIFLAEAWIPLGNHTLLLKGVNDTLPVIKELMLMLLTIRVKTYYLCQTDLNCGINHFRTHSHVVLSIMTGLIGHISGMAIPTLAIDMPGGKGKIPLTPQDILSKGNKFTFNTYNNEICHYSEAKLIR